MGGDPLPEGEAPGRCPFCSGLGCSSCLYPSSPSSRLLCPPVPPSPLRPPPFPRHVSQLGGSCLPPPSVRHCAERVGSVPAGPWLCGSILLPSALLSLLPSLLVPLPSLPRFWLFHLAPPFSRGDHLSGGQWSLCPS